MGTEDGDDMECFKEWVALKLICETEEEEKIEKNYREEEREGEESGNGKEEGEVGNTGG